MTDVPDYIGRFPIEKTLGIGGMGVVYLAKDPDIGRNVAIKVLHSTGEIEDLKRFKNEARTMGEISHPNIVILLEYGIDDKKPFLVMEYLSGISLGQWIKQTHTLREHKNILIQLCSALSFAHNKSILHRDLKPENVQILTGGDAKLLDFGIATGQDKGLTATGFFIGTPKYLAPEILEDTTHTKSSDCYSLGLLAYTMLSGINPFAAETFEASMTKILTKVPMSLHDLNPAIPKEISDVIDGYLNKSSANRPQNPDKLKYCLELITKDSVLNRSIKPLSNIENPQAYEKTLLSGISKRKNKKLLLIVMLFFAMIGTGLTIQYYFKKAENTTKPVDSQSIAQSPIKDNAENIETTNNSLNTIKDNNKIKEELEKPNIDKTKKSDEEQQLAKKGKEIIIKNAQPSKQSTKEKKEPAVAQNNTKSDRKKVTKNKPNIPIARDNQEIKNPTDQAAKLNGDTKNKPIISLEKPKTKRKNQNIVKLPSFGNSSKKIALITKSSTKISRGKTKSIIIDVPEGVKFDDFKIKRGLSDFNQVEIKNTQLLNTQHLQISLYAQSNAPMGDFSLIGYYQNKKTKPLILEVTL